MRLLGLDIGERRIGVAWANSDVKLASPGEVLINDETVFERISELVVNQKVRAIVVGLPRNSKGEETKQSAYVQDFVAKLKSSVPVHFQDESLTSVLAEEQLKSSKKTYSKGDIDVAAAVLILNDYLERNF
ncbi:Holliday junction resolvase RuvX [Candidatus Saccharibacteria bacterium]|nr:Holliday junction resolvase RuvX [Candidatus Saccharibacteria bacterium]